MPKINPPKKVAGEPREVKYPQVEVRILDDTAPLTHEIAMELLGWTPETDEVKLGDDYTLKDYTGTKVLCRLNPGNRPFKERWCYQLSQDILCKHWEFNLETIIIGEFGTVLSGQHRLIALILAYQQWLEQKMHWEKNWPTAPTISTLIAFGAKETPGVKRTLDNVMPRTLTDVLFTGPEFGSYKAHEREKVCRIADHCIRNLWDRTGAKDDAFTPHRTHSEALDFVERHVKLKQCVKHIYEEDGKERRISKWLGNRPGLAAALMYLMGCSASDGDVYRNLDPRTEKKLDWSHWDAANDFFTLLAAGGSELEPVREAIAQLGVVGEEDEGLGSQDERVAILCKGWHLYRMGDKITKKGLVLEYLTDEDGLRTLINVPTFEGIDLGSATQRAQAREEERAEAAAAKEKTKVEAAAAEKVREENARLLKEKNEANKKAKETDGLTEAGVAAQKEQLAEAAAAPTPAPAKKVPPKPISKPTVAAPATNGTAAKPVIGKKPTKVQQEQTAKAKKADEQQAKAVAK